VNFRSGPHVNDILSYNDITYDRMIVHGG